MDDRYGPPPPRYRDRDPDRDTFDDLSRTASRPEPRSQVRLKVPDSVFDDDGSDARDDSDRHGQHRTRHARDENGASDRPALRRRKSVDLEKKTSREAQDFRRRRNELEAQEAGAMRQSDDTSRGYGRRSGMQDDDGRYEENRRDRDRDRREDRDIDGIGRGDRDRRDDRDRDEMGRDDRDRRDDGGGRGGRDRRDDEPRRGDRDRRDDGGRRDARERRDDDPRKSGRHRREDGGRRDDRDRRDDELRKGDRDIRDDEGTSEHGGRRHHGDRRGHDHHEHRREEGRRRGYESRRDDDSRREDRHRRGDEPHRGDESRRGKDSLRDGEVRDDEDRGSDSRRHRKADGVDGADPISDAVSYGSDPIERVASRDDDGRRKQAHPRSGDVLDLDQLLAKPPSGGGGGRRPEREARERDSGPISPLAYDQTRSSREPRDAEDRWRSGKQGYYDPQRLDGRDAGEQGRGYGSAKDRPPRPADWDDRRDRDRR